MKPAPGSCGGGADVWSQRSHKVSECDMPPTDFMSSTTSLPPTDSVPPAAIVSSCGPPTEFFLRSEEEMMVRSLNESLGEMDPRKKKRSENEKEVKDDGSDGNTRCNETNDPEAVTESVKANFTAEYPSQQISAPLPRNKPDSSFQNSPTSVLTPLCLESPLVSSAMSSTPKSASLKSFRLSDEESEGDEVTSQAVISSGEEDDDQAPTKISNDDAGVPQLVMPSITMPSRRPFSAKGRDIGRLKVLVAGASGIGKTCLIKSIIRQCTDIVYVDPFPSATPQYERSTHRTKEQSYSGTALITKLHASTRAYPEWRSHIDDGQARRRRKSMANTILDRNICFVDTPGYKTNAAFSQHTDPVIRFIESLMYQNMSMSSMSDSDMIELLSGNGGMHVDVVLYVLSHPRSIDCQDVTQRDIEYMRRLSSLTNVIPVIGKADTLSTQEIYSFKASILSSIRSSSIRLFLFGQSLDEVVKAANNAVSQHQSSNTEESAALSTLNTKPLSVEKLVAQPSTHSAPVPPFAVSSLVTSDRSEMDASLLMSSTYLSPLSPSDLPSLVYYLFDPIVIPQLRYAAVHKFVEWRRRNWLHADSLNAISHTVSSGRAKPPLIRKNGGTLMMQAINRAGIRMASSSSEVSALPFMVSDLPVELAQLRERVYGEEQIAQAHLAGWRDDLRRGLQSEREKFERLTKEERTEWLLHQVGKEVLEGRIVARDKLVGGGDDRGDGRMAALGGDGNTTTAINKPGPWSIAATENEAAKRRDWGSDVKAPNPRDIIVGGSSLEFVQQRLNWRGRIALRMAGGIGILGAVMIIVAVRAWELDLGIWDFLRKGGIIG